MTKLLYDAHIDEVGVIVTEWVDGFCKIAVIGSPDLRTLPASEVEFIVKNDRVYGVVSALPPHLLQGGESKIIKPDDLYIDTGNVEVPVGTFGTFITSPNLINVGEQTYYTGKAIDNRASAAVLLDVLKRLDGETLNVDLELLFSTQEEVGLRGAKVGAENSAADYAVVIDVTFGQAADTKGHDSFELGKGVTIGVGPNMNRKFTERVRQIAERHGIPYQIEVLPGSSGTNAEVVQLAAGGSATALISIPLRYMHTTAETLDMRDINAASDLLYWLAKEIVIF